MENPLKMSLLVSAFAQGHHLPTQTQVVPLADITRGKAAAQMQRIYADFRQQTALHTFTGSGLVRLLHKTKKRIRNEVQSLDAEYAKEAMDKLDEMILKAKTPQPKP